MRCAPRVCPTPTCCSTGEQHGFRKAENIIRSREAELSFYAQILGFEPGDPIEPVVDRRTSE